MKERLERRLAQPAVIAAVVTGVGTGIAAVAAGLITSRSSEEQLEGTLIVEAVKVCDKKQAVSNLKISVGRRFPARSLTGASEGYC